MRVSLGALSSMRSVIAVVQRKGGVGKTTIAVNLAGELYERGHWVLTVDADDQRSAVQWGEPGCLAFPVRELPIKWGRAKEWVAALEECQGDILIVDTPPNDYAIGAAVAVADLVLVPCTPSGLDLDAAVQALSVVNAVRPRRRGVLPVLLVPNRVDAHTLEGQQLAQELGNFSEPVAPQLGNRTAFVRAFSVGQTINIYAQGTASDREMKALCDRVVASIPAGRSARGAEPLHQVSR